MTVHINTINWHVEYSEGIMWITSRATGLTMAVKGKGLVAELYACLKTHTHDQVAETFSRLNGPKGVWLPIYKRIPDLPDHVLAAQLFGEVVA